MKLVQALHAERILNECTAQAEQASVINPDDRMWFILGMVPYAASSVAVAWLVIKLHERRHERRTRSDEQRVNHSLDNTNGHDL